MLSAGVDGPSRDLTGAHFYRRSDDDVPLGDPRTLLVFLLAAAVVGPLVSAIFGVGGLVWSGLAPLDTAHVLLTTWWVGDGIGALVLGPTILFVAHGWHGVRHPDRFGEWLGVVGWLERLTQEHPPIRPDAPDA